MDFLKSYLFLSFLISCVYFIIKSLLNRMNKNKEEYEFVRKSLFKDTLLLFVISYLVLVCKAQLLIVGETKTQVFTNEPSF